MKLERLPNNPSALIDFFQESLESLGAVCERSWHDRLHLVAEGTAACLWNPDGALTETEIHFLPQDAGGIRQAQTEVFPGCPLTFHLAEQLCPASVSLERCLLRPAENARPPAPETAEKLWHAQFPGASRWHLDSTFLAAWHASLLALARCEIQAIDQHWTLHRVAVSLPDGQRDDSLAAGLDFAQLQSEASAAVEWPKLDLNRSRDLLQRAFATELGAELVEIRVRQQRYLRRELERIDGYFENYEQELAQRQSRSHSEAVKHKAEERLAAAKTEHGRRRDDQIRRHEIRVIIHLDALLLILEPAWTAKISLTRKAEPQQITAVFVPRSRRWVAQI
jgi:hypothetical protein